MAPSYAPFIDWLKCLGITLILFGHFSAGWLALAQLPPIYVKQIGVALFLFASGYSLAGETRERWRVVFNRLFDVFLFGIACALLLSITGFLADGHVRLSNYLPFLAGVNVLFDNFPANPTTWYLGTYLHFVLIWACVVSRIRVTPAILAASVVLEIAVRAILMRTAGLYVAYMLVPNWATVFLLGCWHRQRQTPATASAAWPLAGLVLSIAGWSALTRLFVFERTFPFMQIEGAGGLGGALAISLMVSAIYIGSTELVYRTVSSLPAPAPVRFIARNTLVIFLAHMPLLDAMAPYVGRWPVSAFLRSATYLTVCLPGLALVSEAIRGWVRPRELRDQLLGRLTAAGER